MDSNFQKALEDFALDVESPEKNYTLARYYEDQGSTASALTHYLKAAERTSDIHFSYECLIRSAVCVSRQGGRGFTQSHLLKQAICDIPTRPEAYFFLCTYYEGTKSWYECYLMASIALDTCDFMSPSVFKDAPGLYGYLGRDGLELLKAVSGIHWEKLDESIRIFRDLSIHSESEQIRSVSVNNLQVLGV